MNFSDEEIKRQMRLGEDIQIRISMFPNRIEIISPGNLPNNLTIDNMDVRQSTRNEALASILEGDLVLEMQNLQGGGSVIFPEATGNIPGLSGRLNPIRDTQDRTYLYASNIAINEGQQQPVTFIPKDDLHLTAANGRELIVRIVAIIGRSALLEYYPYSKRDQGRS